MARGGGYEEALPLLDAVVKQSQNKDTLAQAWLYEGDSFLALRRWEPAIMAYLRVPVFYSDKKLLVPQAMLGGARAMIGLQDRKAAKNELDDLVKNFPSSPQASAAQSELQKLERDQNQKP
jgi:outer membrane protein assembly factor BamD (BamD/ComL family)